MRKYNLDINYFSKITSHEKAYVLGFLYADGSNRGDGITFTQNYERIDILENIKTALKSDSPIRKTEKGHCILDVFSDKIAKDVAKLGVIKNKSLVLQFPTTDIIPLEYMPSFILGYFDGDGCVWNGKRKKIIVKDKQRKEGFRKRIVHNVKFTFTGCVSFIKPLQEFLLKTGIVNNRVKLNYSKANASNNNTCDKVCTLEYSGRKQLENLYNYMYAFSPIWCKEKKLKFETIICALNEKSLSETGLIAGKPEMVISSQAVDNTEGSSTIPEMEVELSNSKCPALNE